VLSLIKNSKSCTTGSEVVSSVGVFDRRDCGDGRRGLTVVSGEGSLTGERDAIATVCLMFTFVISAIVASLSCISTERSNRANFRAGKS
jgi:hypothetical protein